MSRLSDRLIQDMIDHNISYELIYHDEIWTIEDGKKKSNIPVDKILKTLAFNVDNRYIFAVLQGNRQVNYSKLASALNSSRKSISRLPAEILENELGYEIGGVSPLHIDSRIETVFDSHVTNLYEVYCSVGTRNMTLKINIEDLLFLSHARIYNISK